MFRTSSASDSPVFLISTKVLYLALILLFGQAQSAGVLSGFLDRQVAGGFTSPSALTVLSDGRVLVLQQNGVVRIIKNDAVLPANFYAVANVDSFAERGCLGITTDPDFTVNHFVYLYCTVKSGDRSFNRVLRVTEANDTAVAGSEQVIFALPDVPAGVQWHMGGGLRFGIDGKLYVGVGGHEDNRLDPSVSNSQKLSNPFGKILRINADGSIPNDNPYVNTPGALAANFNLGLRNPYTIDIQAGTGLLYINDVGAGSWEEINKGQAGANYGWPAVEGNTDDGRFANPVFVYAHGADCAITAGAFYNPPTSQFPATYVGKYFFADFCSGSIRFIDPASPAQASNFAADIDNPVGIAVAPDGSLYYLARNQSAGASATATGTLGKISFTNTQLPRITLQPQAQTVFLGDPATFTVKVDGAEAMQWQRNGVDIPGATSSSYTMARTEQSDHQASFAVVVRNGFGSTMSSPAVLSITTDRLPQASISSPAEDSRSTSGETIAYAGAGIDAEDGQLPPAAFTWRADFMHDTHSHPFLAATSGATSGSLTVPEFEADAANTWFRLYLTVKDSKGQIGTVTRDVYPRTQLSDLTPAGTTVNGLGPIEKNRNNGDAVPGDGGIIALDGISYAKGLGVFAPSDVGFDLGGACSGRFVTDVGIDDLAGARGSAAFQVWLDGVKAFDSGVMSGADPRKSVNISVAGKKRLRLVVTDGGDGNAFDFANWAGARVAGCTAAASATGAPAAPAASAAAADAGAAPALISPAGGGGCAIGGDGRYDPTLLILIAVAFAWSGRHRSGRRRASRWK
ncbi:MAG TPA: PQQ-dependent sugar dehydrogenase [Noviherbaspirillum sp.]|nr:PQQ-dependent sugar dehydrogenase [Noviherbaspirillum sp.]